MQIRANSPSDGILKARRGLSKFGQKVSTDTWQGDKSGFEFLEILNLNLIFPMVNIMETLKIQTNPDLPWADKHFIERTGGQPLNPPPSHKLWLKDTENYMSGKRFSHSYPERMWPKTLMPDGIRFETADLSDAIELLKKDPTTRQCYLPIYFPEDLTAALAGERVPCTLGWHFIIRGNQLHCFYPMRSCDALRHFHNDMYFANRLALYVAEQAGLNVEMGNLSFSCTSFHCFSNDEYALKKSIGE